MVFVDRWWLVLVELVDIIRLWSLVGDGSYLKVLVLTGSGCS